MNVLMNTAATYSSTDLAYIGAKLLEVREVDGKKFIFAQADGAVAKYDIVIIDEAGQAVKASTTTSATALGDRCGVAQVAVADNYYAWFQIYGVSTINVLASCAANVRINTTATAGSLDDDHTSGAEYIEGIALTTARAASAGSAPCMLNFPVVRETI